MAVPPICPRFFGGQAAIPPSVRWRTFEFQTCVPIGGDCEKGSIGTSLVLSTDTGLYLVALSLGESTCSSSLYSRTSPALDWIQKTIAANGIQAGPLPLLTLTCLALVVFLAL